MSTEDVKKEGAENHDEKHGSLLGKIIEKIDGINTDFPLSGGEEPSLHTHVEKQTEEEIEAEKKKAEHKKTSFLHDLNKEFPLSGGE